MFTSCHFRLQNHEHYLLNYEHYELFSWNTATENLSAKGTTVCVASNGFTKSHNVSARKSTGTYRVFQGLCVRMDRWRALVGMVRNLRVPKMQGIS